MTRPTEPLDALGLEITLDENDLVVGALILLKILEPDGNTRLQQTHAGIGWMERAGILTHALHLEHVDVDARDI